MNQIPIQTFLVPILVLGVVVFFLIRQKKLTAGWEQTNAKFRLSEFAQRLRLSIVEGDPNFNLMMAATATDSQAPVATTGGVVGALKEVAKAEGRQAKNIRVLLRGAPNGRPTEYVYFHHEDLDVGIVINKLTTTFDCRLTIRVARPFSPFEIVLRKPGMAMDAPPVMSLPPVSLGDPLLDAKFILSTVDPSVAPALAAALAPLVNLAFFHIQAHDQSMHFVMTTFGSSAVLPSMEQVQYALEQMAAALERRAAPGAMAS